MFESLKDILLGPQRYCWQVTADGAPVGYLCEDYEMFRDLILGSNIPPGAIIRVTKVFRRYRPPRNRVTNPFTQKGERRRAKPTAAHQAKTKTKSKSTRRKRKRWHWNTRFPRIRRH